jgi:hypothetical protein
MTQSNQGAKSQEMRESIARIVAMRQLGGSAMLWALRHFPEIRHG